MDELVLIPVPPGLKCPKCGQFKDVECFAKSRKNRSGRFYMCRSCKSEHLDKPYNKRTTEQRSLRTRSRRYDITVGEYRKLLEYQSGVCAICKSPETKVMKGTVCTLAVDHDHETGRVRGLLCDKCNRGMGFFADDIDLFYAAVSYLEAHS